jgi:MFS family permease
MTTPPQASTGGWLAAAGHRAKLPHGDSDISFAQRVTRNLVDARSAQVLEILDEIPSTARVSAWAALLGDAGAADLFEFFAYRPADMISVLAPELPELRRWSTLVEICEACYALAAHRSGDPAGAGGLPYAGRISAAHLARTRWVLLSVPFTIGPQPDRLDLLRLNDDTGRLTALAQQARDDWLAVLAAIDDYPQLAGRLGDAEADIMSLATIRVASAVLQGAGCAADQTAAAGDRGDPPGREAAQFAVTRLLLPRFAWSKARRVYLRSAGQLSRWLSTAALAAALAALALAALGSIPGWSWAYTAAAVSAAVTYLLVTVTTAADARAAWPWLLRQPASAAVGLLALAAFGSDWWHPAVAGGHTGAALVAAAGLVGAGLAYLYIEAAGHGVRGRRLAWRPPVIGLFGLIHSLLISLIGLRFLLPVFASTPAGGPALSCWYAIHSCHGTALPVPVLLALATAWSFAAGVFLQIVWDDQPVTAPLAHVSWHRGG